MKEIESAAMPLNEATEAQLLAYAYGELSGPEARAFEQRLQGDAELRAELASLQATRELFGRDQRFGLDTKVDEPPPHLVDAILRAEALARPPELREARALAARPTLTARLSRWLVGGGILVGATAAVMLVVSRTSDEAVLVSLPSAAAPAALPEQEADGKAAKVAAAPAEEAPGDGERDLRARLAADPARPAPDAPAPLSRGDEAPPPTEAPEEPAVGRKGGARAALEDADRGGVALGAAGPAGSGGAPSTGVQVGSLANAEAQGRAHAGGEDLAKDQPVSAAPMKPRPEPKPESDSLREAESSERAPARAKTEAKERANVAGGDLSFDAALDEARPGSARPTTASSAPPPAPAPASTPVVAPSAAPSSSLGTSAGLITRDEARAARQRYAEERRAQSEKAKKSSSQGEGAPADKAPPSAPSKLGALGGKADDAKKSVEKAPLPQAGPEAKRSMQAEMSLLSGYRELKDGRALDALDEFQSAERLDSRRQLGSDPHMGQMRALVALKRPAEALAIARRLVTRDLNEVGVVDGLLFGARLAENNGDLRTARELWTVLLKVPAQKSVASAALARLAHPAVRATDDAAEAAAEAPAAAAPATKE